MKNFLITLFQTFLFSFLFTSSFAQHSCSHKPGDHVRACGLQAIYEDMNTQVPPPADFVAGGPRDVVISVTYNGFASFPAAQAAFQYAVDIWASTLTSNVPITVDATFSNIGGGTLGFAYANGYWINFSGAEESDVYYPSALADKLAGFNIDPGSPDIVTEFNNGTNWYFGTDGNTPSGQFDFVTVVLHELGHGLGVAGFGAVNGGLGTVSSNGDPSIYDFYAEDGSGTPLTDYSQNSTSLAAQLTSNNLFWNGSLAVGNNGGMEPKLYAPSTWASGSSYSHVDEDSYPAGSGNSLMTPFVGQAESNHNPGPIIIGLMGDIGWDTTTDGGCPLNEATLSLTTDCYPGETSWMIEDEFGAILYSANAGSLPDLTTINTPLCLEEGCYTVTISDTFGDGLAGSLEDACGIDGDYELTDDLGNILVSMEAANFGSSISHDFCLSGSGGELFGCTDPAATNYDSAATIDDGSCDYDVLGCTDPSAINYNPDATVDDGSCVYDSDDCVINSINVYPNGCGENGIQNMQYTFDYSGDCIVQEICVVGVDAGNDFCADLSDNNFGSGDVSGWVNFPEAGDYDFYYTLSDGTVSPTGTLTLESCTPNEGCTNPYALNYDSTADIDDESCVYDDTICDCSGAVHTLGVLVWVGDGFADDSAYEWEGQLVDFDCIDWAFDCGDINGDNGADPYNVCDGSFPLNMPPNNGCLGDIFGCTDPDATNYNPDATVDDGSCDYEVLGCTDSSANNYNPDATIDDGSCDYDVMGCTLIDACNYDPLATINDGSCDYSCQGCTNPAACNYDADATVEDGSCDFTCLGCTDPSACNYDPTATIDNGSCDYNCLGCTLIDACNYDPGATIDDGSCDFTCYGCTDTEATNYDPGATIDDGSCIYGEIEGCTDSTACNFDQFANVEDGSCEYVSCMGCTDIEACNWDPTATMDDGSCDYDCYGCTDSEATNYDPDATIDDGSCIYGEIEGCTDSEACNYDDFATTDDGTCEYETCSGCTDSTALNYDDTATIDDGSCVYDCVYPTMIFSAFCEDGESTGFFVEMNIIDLGNGAPYAISNNQNSDVIQLSFNGVINLGPFDNGDQVVITVVSELYPDCLITSPLLTMNCDPDNVEEEAFAGAKIFPNPNSGEFTINVGDHQGSVTMDIYEITGKLITSEQFVVVEGENHHVSLHDDLAFGTYVLMLNSSAKNEQFRLVIK